MPFGYIFGNEKKIINVIPSDYEQIKQDISENQETVGSAASKAYVVGEFFRGSDEQFYKVTAAIASGATIVVGTNCQATDIGTALQEGGSGPAGPLPEYTLAEYEALPVAERPEYWIRTDADYNSYPASQISYDNSSSTGLPANVQGAITKLNADIIKSSFTVNLTSDVDANAIGGNRAGVVMTDSIDPNYSNDYTMVVLYANIQTSAGRPLIASFDDRNGVLRVLSATALSNTPVDVRVLYVRR